MTTERAKVKYTSWTLKNNAQNDGRLLIKFAHIYFPPMHTIVITYINYLNEVAAVKYLEITNQILHAVQQKFLQGKHTVLCCFA